MSASEVPFRIPCLTKSAYGCTTVIKASAWAGHSLPDWPNSNELASRREQSEHPS